MPICTVRWRPSGGRGEYEFVPSNAMMDRWVAVRLDAFGIDIQSEVYGTNANGKPRLRKNDSNNRSKMHLVPLVMAIARLPEPAREDKGELSWPLEDKGFIVSHMDFDIIADDGTTVIARPISARILHAEDKVIDLQSRLAAVASDYDQHRLEHLWNVNRSLAEALIHHRDTVLAAVNDSQIREAASMVVGRQVDVFGMSNMATVSTAENLPPTPLEDDIVGIEGRVLTRLHSYRERDRGFVLAAKQAFRARHGTLFCECCGIVPGFWYGERGEDRIQAHHRTPVEQLLPDTVTTPEDLAMVCPSCHDIIHARRPWISVEELRQRLLATGHHYFQR